MKKKRVEDIPGRKKRNTIIGGLISLALMVLLAWITITGGQ